jgi:hypothetical protein
LKAEEDMKAINEAFSALTRLEKSPSSPNDKDNLLREQLINTRTRHIPPPYFQAHREYLKHQPIHLHGSPGAPPWGRMRFAAARSGVAVFVLLFAVLMTLTVVTQNGINLMQVLRVLLIALSLTLALFFQQTPSGKNPTDMKR